MQGTQLNIYILEALLKVSRPVLNSTNHHLGVDEIKLA